MSLFYFDFNNEPRKKSNITLSLDRVCRNTEILLVSVRHAGSPIELRTGPIRHPVAERSENKLYSLRCKYIEPRVEPGMTNCSINYNTAF